MKKRELKEQLDAAVDRILKYRPDRSLHEKKDKFILLKEKKKKPEGSYRSNGD